MQNLQENSALAVLIVDDDIPSGIWLSKQISIYGYQTWNVTSALEALALSKQMSFDFVFTDCRMSEMSGFELVNILRQQVTFQDTLIIGMTASMHSLDFYYGIAQGMDICLTKPLAKEKLKQIFEKGSVFQSTSSKGIAIGNQSVNQEHVIQHDSLKSYSTYQRRWKLSGKKRIATVDQRSTVVVANQKSREKALGVVHEADFLNKSHIVHREFLLTVQANNFSDIEALESAIASENHQEMAHIAHKVRGIASIMGYSDVAQTAANLEAASLDALFQFSVQNKTPILQLGEYAKKMRYSLFAFNQKITKRLQDTYE